MPSIEKNANNFLDRLWPKKAHKKGDIFKKSRAANTDYRLLKQS